MSVNEHIVVPGMPVKRIGRVRLGEHLRRYDKKIIPTLLGVLHKSDNELSVIAYKDIYKPRAGDYVVGVVISYAPNGWVVELGTFTKGFLPAQDYIRDVKFNPKDVELSRYIKVGDIVGAKIQEANRYGYFLLTCRVDKKDRFAKYIGVLRDFYIIKISSTKLPRVIGKKGSMIKIIKEKIDGELIVSQNGVILYRGNYENFLILKKIVGIIVYKTFASGLTDVVASILGVQISGEKGGENEREEKGK